MMPWTTLSLLTASLDELAALSSETLFHLQQEAVDQRAMAGAIVKQLDQVLIVKYSERAQACLQAAGQASGVVHFSDGHVRITAEQPRQVVWDQCRLAEMVRRLAAHGGDPTEYVETRYHVSEARFNAWPTSLKQMFEPARSLKRGAPRFRLALRTEGDES